jgi:hypothetical protein
MVAKAAMGLQLWSAVEMLGSLAAFYSQFADLQAPLFSSDELSTYKFSPDLVKAGRQTTK